MWDLGSTMTCLYALLLNLWTGRKWALAQNLNHLQTSSTCTPERGNKDGMNEKFPWMCITGEDIWVFHGIIECLKILWRWLESAFLLFPILCVRGNEWDCSHPCFIIQEQGSLNRAEDQWIIRLLKGIFFFFHYTLCIACETHSIEITRSKA